MYRLGASGERRRPQRSTVHREQRRPPIARNDIWDECLNINCFESLEDAATKIEAWRQDYNSNHPHRALRGLSPMNMLGR